MSETRTRDAATAGVAGTAATALGYTLSGNPQGFVLGVLLDALVGWIEGGAEAVASTIAETWALLTETLVEGGAAAVGTPGRIVAGLVLDLVGLVDDLATDLAASAGPASVVVVPVVWGLALVAAVGLLLVVWNGYKWVRTVVM